jgi:tetratricopeptide (TPR) repeat protein
MTDRDSNEEPRTMSPNTRRGLGLIKDRVDVRWPASHVELALIQLQRRRQQRRALAALAALGLSGLALVGTWGLATHARGGVAVRGLVSRLATAGAKSVTAASPVAPVAVAAPAPSTLTGVATRGSTSGPASPAAPEGHLLQQRLVPRRQVAAARWVALAGERRFGEAYGLLQKVPLRDIADANDLLLAADVAREAGSPAHAVPFLERVVREHPHELSAQLAGFSLGKIYLDAMDDPGLAARTFAEVRALAPAGGLAQDALAREVEAWSRAGRADRARASAAEYVRLYPNGRRVAAVRDLGGI